jgi:hypothetical protein
MLYTICVLSPSAALVATSASSRRWPISARAVLDGTKLLLALASFTVYAAVVFGYLHLKAGFTFLVVPLASWLVIGIVAVSRWLLGR